MLTNQKVNSGPNFELWSEEQLHELHLASLKILENTGVVVHDAEALKLLKDAGAFVEENVAKIPAPRPFTPGRLNKPAIPPASPRTPAVGIPVSGPAPGPTGFGYAISKTHLSLGQAYQPREPV